MRAEAPPVAVAVVAPPAGPAADAGLGSAEEALHRRLTWLTLFRLAMVTVLLGGTASITWDVGVAGGPAARLYGVIAATYVASLLLAIGLRARWAPVALAYAHVALDVAVAAAVVSLTGHAESVFVFMFSLAIVNGSILLFRRGAIAGTALALVAYLVVTVLGPAAGGGRIVAEWRAIFVHGSAFVLTAALSGYLAEQLRRTGERLVESESDLAAITALHEAIVQSVASGLLTFDPEGRITFLNRAGEQITGLRLADVAGRPVAAWFASFQVPGEGEPRTRRDEADVLGAGGERLRVGYTTFPLVGREGEGIGTAVIFQDLTQLRALEAAVQRKARLADLGQLAAGLAHELRNPLASMTGSVEILRASSSLDGGERRLMDIVLREAARLNDLVTSFLEFARPSPPRRVTTDLRQVVEQTLEVFSHDPGFASVRLESAIGPAIAECDPDQLRQVVWNLLTNAAQACRARRDGGRVRVACGAVAGGVELAVRDDGPGIAPVDLPRIFTPFFTTKPDGTGLGLATVHRIVDAHGGTVSVESAPGRGASFTVRLPARCAADAMEAG